MSNIKLEMNKVADKLAKAHQILPQVCHLNETPEASVTIRTHDGPSPRYVVENNA
jgi:hypothetical protein